MTYLPINTNINHLLTNNTFRLDTVENMTPIKWGGYGSSQKTKKYEYFYNKTDLMMSILGNGATGASNSSVILDNINIYETDMIPFFKYFQDDNIYKGVQIPFVGEAPNIDYLSSDFVFIDNITISVDTLEPGNGLSQSCSIIDLSVDNYSIDFTNDNANNKLYVLSGTNSVLISTIVTNLLVGDSVTSWSWTAIGNSDVSLSFTNTANVQVIMNSTSAKLQVTATVTKANGQVVEIVDECDIVITSLPNSNTPILENITITGVSLISNNNVYRYQFNSNFNITNNIFSEVRPIGGLTWGNPLIFNGSTSPQNRTVSLTTPFETRIYSLFGNDIVYSNIFIVQPSIVLPTRPTLVAGINDISKNTTQTRSLIINNNTGETVYIFIGVNNFYTGSGGASAQDSVSSNFKINSLVVMSSTNSIQNTISYSAPITLQNNSTISGLLSVLPTNDQHYQVNLYWSDSLLGDKELLVN